MGTNLLLLNFASTVERQRILLQSPWPVLGFHVILKPWKANTPPNEIDFSTTSLWIQIHNLPLEHQIAENANRIGALFYKLLEVDTCKDLRSSGPSFIRIRIEHLVREPLKNSFYIERDNLSPLWIQFKYKRISEFCFSCGRLGHTNYSCSTKINSSQATKEWKFSVNSFGPWMLLERKKYDPEKKGTSQQGHHSSPMREASSSVVHVETRHFPFPKKPMTSQPAMPPWPT